jgi:hypothetical protein
MSGGPRNNAPCGGENGGIADQLRRCVLDEKGELIDWQIADDQDCRTTLGLCLDPGGRCAHGAHTRQAPPRPAPCGARAPSRPPTPVRCAASRASCSRSCSAGPRSPPRACTPGTRSSPSTASRSDRPPPPPTPVQIGRPTPPHPRANRTPHPSLVRIGRTPLTRWPAPSRPAWRAAPETRVAALSGFGAGDGRHSDGRHEAPRAHRLDLFAHPRPRGHHGRSHAPVCSEAAQGLVHRVPPRPGPRCAPPRDGGARHTERRARGACVVCGGAGHAADPRGDRRRGGAAAEAGVPAARGAARRGRTATDRRCAGRAIQ